MVPASCYLKPWLAFGCGHAAAAAAAEIIAAVLAMGTAIEDRKVSHLNLKYECL